MLKIDERNNITLTRGDTLTVQIALRRGTQTYTPEEGDAIRIACSNDYYGEVLYDLMFEAPIPDDTLTVTIPASTTKGLDYGVYNYDVEITHADGCVDTVLSAKLIITGEVK